jgi:acetyl-CoA carboxylase carboxyl transferase subunit alpha
MVRMAEHEAGKLAQVQAAAAPVSEVWRRTELARHPDRPHPMDFIEALFTDFSEIHGDRAFGDDLAMTAGMAFFHGEPVLVIGNLKGRTTKDRIARRFGQPDPEGYRKALRAMKIAEKFGRPIFSFIDLAGAYPGVSAEERGQGEAIARNLIEMSRLRVPTIATITGEGGSGGALALAVADRVLMLENAIYTVITPESCAAITWKDSSKKQLAAAALKYTSFNAKDLGCVDDVLTEPEGGTHLDPAAAIAMIDEKLRFHLAQLDGKPIELLLEERYRKFRNIAQFYTTAQ